MTTEEKWMIVSDLLLDVHDILVHKFFDINSEEQLDLKIEVLTQLKNGVPPSDIPEYYSILELYPADGEMWD